MSYGDYSNRVPPQGGDIRPPKAPKQNKIATFFKNMFSFGSVGSGSNSGTEDWGDLASDRKITANPPTKTAAWVNAQKPLFLKNPQSDQSIQRTKPHEQPTKSAAPQPQSSNTTHETVSQKPEVDTYTDDEIRNLIMEEIEKINGSTLYYDKKLDREKALLVVYNLKPEDFGSTASESIARSMCRAVKSNLQPKFARAVRMQVVPREQERDIPPIGGQDTLNGELRSNHGQTSFISDDKILEKNQILKTVDIGNNDYPYIPVNYTSNNKPILQQQATRGCTAGATAMLILDKGGTVDLQELTNTNLGNDSTQADSIRKAGFEPFTPELSRDNWLSDLRNAILQNGSAILGVRAPGIGNHAIVVDDISPKLDRVRIRDPYHGWEITISAETFLGINPSGPMQLKEAQKADNAISKQ